MQSKDVVCLVLIYLPPSDGGSLGPVAYLLQLSLEGQQVSFVSMIDMRIGNYGVSVMLVNLCWFFFIIWSLDAQYSSQVCLVLSSSLRRLISLCPWQTPLQFHLELQQFRPMPLRNLCLFDDTIIEQRNFLSFRGWESIAMFVQFFELAVPFLEDVDQFFYGFAVLDELYVMKKWFLGAWALFVGFVVIRSAQDSGFIVLQILSALSLERFGWTIFKNIVKQCSQRLSIASSYLVERTLSFCFNLQFFLEVGFQGRQLLRILAHHYRQSQQNNLLAKNNQLDHEFTSKPRY